MRLIDADALEKEIEEITKEPDYQHEGEDWSVGVIIAQSAVQDAPTIEAVPVVHAEWKMRGGKLYCTNCGKKALEEKDRDDWYGCERSNFCPHCGADMRKKVRYATENV